MRGSRDGGSAPPGGAAPARSVFVARQEPDRRGRRSAAPMQGVPRPAPWPGWPRAPSTGQAESGPNSGSPVEDSQAHARRSSGSITKPVLALTACTPGASQTGCCLARSPNLCSPGDRRRTSSTRRSGSGTSTARSRTPGASSVHASVGDPRPSPRGRRTFVQRSAARATPNFDHRARAWKVTQGPAAGGPGDRASGDEAGRRRHMRPVMPGGDSQATGGA